MNFNVKYSCVSHIGKCREINQDNFICDGHYKEKNEDTTNLLVGKIAADTNALFGVFDGIGGESCGEKAAYIAAKTASKIEFSENTLQTLSDYCKTANDEICLYAKNNNIKSMGTTAALIVFAKDGIGLCNVGDTKIFRFSENRLAQISKDHIITSSYYEKPILTQNLGIPEDEKIIQPFFAKGRYKDGDMFIICSDGLTDLVSKLKIENLLNNNPNINVAETLLDTALDKGGRDNITILVCMITEKKHNEMFCL